MTPNQRELLTTIHGYLATVLASVSDDPEIRPAVDSIRALHDKVSMALEGKQTEVKSQMPTMSNSRRNSLLASIISIFKAVPQEQLEDLADALNADAPVGRDLWNGGDRIPDQQQNPTGQTMAASGDGGTRAVDEYSRDRGAVVPGTTGHGDGISRAYAEMGAELAEMRTRVADLEKAQTALAGAFCDMIGMSRDATVGKSEDAAAGPIERTREDEKDDVEKGRVQSLTIGRLMHQLSDRARQATVPPPNFAKAQSAVQVVDTDTLDVDQAIAVKTLRTRMDAYNAGHIKNLEQVYAGLETDLPDNLKPHFERRIVVGG